MKASFALALAGSILAVASPIDKRVIHTEYVTDLVLVTVTVDPTTTKPTTHHTTTHHTTTTPKTTSIKATTTSTTSTPPPPPPAPTTPTTTSTTSTPPPPPPSSTPHVNVITITEGAASSTAPAATSAPAVQPAAAQAPAEVESSSPAAAATTSAAASASEPTNYGSTAVYHHNLHRSNHSAPAVSYDSDLASYAATAAASCVFAHNLTPGASTGAYGQNIAVYGASGDVSSIDPSQIVAQAITDMWYNGEVWQFPADGYGESNPDMSNFESWGHFSQVVWVASTSVGCASQYCAPGTIYSGMGSWFTVCNYRSEGNMGGGYGTNVLPSLGEATVTA